MRLLPSSNEIDGRTDLYALGSSMFRLLTGRKVHESSSSNEAMIKVATESARPLRTVMPEASANIAEIVDRALRFNRDERYPTAAAMRDDVRAAIAGTALPSFTPGSMRGASAPFLAAVAAEPTVGVAIAATLQREPPAAIARRKPPIALFAGIGAVLLLFAIFGLAYVCWPAPHDDGEEAEEKRRPLAQPKPTPEPEVSASAEPSATAPKPAATPKPTTPKKPVFESDGKGGWKKKN